MEERERYEAGLRMRRTVLGEAHVDRSLAKRNSFNEEFQEAITRHVWGEIWTRPGLDRKTRSLTVLSIMAALGRWEEFKLHIRAAPGNGVSREEIKEILLQVMAYCGVPAANTAFHLAEEIFAAVEQG